MEYLEVGFPDRLPLLSKDVDEMLLAKQIEVVVEDICDATRDLFFEEARGGEAESGMEGQTGVQDTRWCESGSGVFKAEMAGVYYQE